MYPDLSKIEQSEDRPPSVGIGFALPSDPSDDPKRRLLEASIDSIRALKGFIAQYDRVKDERDQLKRQMADRLDEVETLRDEIQQLKAQRDEFSNTLSTLVSQMGTAVRKAQRFIDIHVSNRNRRWFPAFRNDEGGQLQADLKLIENAPATPTDPSPIPPDPADLMREVLATWAGPSSMTKASDPADLANAPATPADPSSPASDPTDVMKKVLATWAEASSMPKAPDLAEPSTPAPSASKAE